MLQRYMHNLERDHAMRDDNRVVHPFGWGTEFIGEHASGDEPKEVFSEYSRQSVVNSDEFFFLPEISNFKSQISNSGEQVTWTSGIETPSPENNTVYAHYFPNPRGNKTAVLILPHWNAKTGTYFDLAKIFNRVGISALRMTMPYHENRNPPECERADYLVAPNVGRTLQSLRQAVVDARSAVSWLKQQGYEKIGVLGTSIGSCVGFFVFVHDMRIDAGVFNHVSGYPADVVWHGITTYHVKEGLEGNLTLDELREYWLPISPMSYIEKLAAQTPRPQRYIYGLYDLSFPVNLSRDIMAELRRHNINHSEVRIPCGHYTLGEKPFVWYDGWKIVSFLRKHLK
ncbi:MAG: abhydrolase domain-containing 18 [Chloracidobacterium sp.]|nr:abhydrolase domain-containing 18 [Chloracidobacterium sp.]